MGNTFFFEWEPQLMVFLQSLIGPVGVKIASFLSMFGEEYIMVVVFGFLYLCWDKQAGIFVGTNLMVNLTLNPLVKNIFMRRRPYFDHAGVKCLKPVDSSADIYDLSAQGYSFPSGHSNNASTMYGSVAAVMKKKWIWITAVVVILLVGISRVILGVHYPTDVLVGWTMGIVIIVVMSFLQKKVQRKWLLYLILVLLSSVGWFYCRSNDYYSGFGMMIGFFAGLLFEKKFVNFEETHVWWRIILRLLAGMGPFVGLNKLLKLPFPKDLLEEASITQYIIRTIRYMIVIFILTGVYPMCFRLFKSRKKEKAEE